MKRAAAGTTLGFLIFAPTLFFTLILALIVGPFAIVLPAWVLWFTSRRLANMRTSNDNLARAGLVR